MVLRNAKQLEGHALHARDGVIGKVKDFYFDDLHWRIRYCVVETGEWLQSRRVLIAPTSMEPYDANEGAFPVTLTMDQVRHSPDAGSERLISRQYEAALHKYYGLPVYWGGLFGEAAIMPSLIATTAAGAPDEPAVVASEQPAAAPPADPFLRSMNDTIGYHLEASDGPIGHMEDFLIHAEDWSIRYLVVDPRNWWPGPKVVISPDLILTVDWEKSRVIIDLTRDAIRGSPTYDPSTPWLDYSTRLDEYYRERRQGRG